MTVELNLMRVGGAGDRRRVDVRQLVIAGWTGRDAAAVEAHIRELEEIGVPRPASVPTFYRAAAALLTTEAAIQVLGRDSSGEVEPVLLAVDGELWIGVGSDHTDRAAEWFEQTLPPQRIDDLLCCHNCSFNIGTLCVFAQS